MIIIDFDDTLFNTREFKERRLLAVSSLGVDEKIYWNSYNQARVNDQGASTYSNKLHAEVLETHGFSYEKILKVLEETTKPEVLTKFVFKNASNFLIKLRALKQTLILLSLGEPNMQELKVKGSGLHDFFDRVFFVEQTKIHVLNHLFTQESARGAWLINDKIIESQEIKAHFPGVDVILKEFSEFTETDYERSGLVYYKKFDEIYDHIVNHTK